MSPTNADALAHHVVSTGTHDQGHVVARHNTLEQHPTATATVESQKDGVTTSEQRSSPAQINQFPNEILCQIFLLVHVKGWITRTALDLGQVCRLWWYIVTGTASFWTDVRSGQLDLARLSVERSKQASLKFFLPESYSHRLIGCYRSPHLYPVFPEKAVNLLIANIGRIGTLAVKMHYEKYSALVPHLAHFTAPCLKVLHLDIAAEGLMGYQMQANFHCPDSVTRCRLLNAPLLEQLSLRTRRLHGEIKFHHNIVSLTLLLDAGGYHDSSHILGTFRAHKKLVDLRLVLKGPLSMSEHDTKVRLLRLKRLSLEARELGDANYLLHRLEIPGIAQVDLDLGSRSRYLLAPSSVGRLLTEILSPLPSTLLRIPKSAKFDSSEFVMVIDMKKNPWSQPKVSICLRWHGPIEMIIPGVVESLVENFPRLSVASFDGNHLGVKRKAKVKE